MGSGSGMASGEERSLLWPRALAESQGEEVESEELKKPKAEEG